MLWEARGLASKVVGKTLCERPCEASSVWLLLACYSFALKAITEDPTDHLVLFVHFPTNREEPVRATSKK